MNAIVRGSALLSLLRCFAALHVCAPTARSDCSQNRSSSERTLRLAHAPLSGRATFRPINLGNSSRLDSLIRAGNLYLSAQDVIALALENNIDIEVQRYGPLLAREVLRRAEGGGLLRNVGQGVVAGPDQRQPDGRQHQHQRRAVELAAAAASMPGGGIVTQLGPSIPSFDPTISGFTNFQHATSPQSNTHSDRNHGADYDNRTFQASYSQNWSFGLIGHAYLRQHAHEYQQHFCSA